MKQVLSVENMRNSDRKAQESIPSRELMLRAGKAVYEYSSWEYPSAIVCGAGNNAGDGFVIAELMHQAGNECTVFLTGDRFSPDGKYYFDQCAESNVPVRRLDADTDLSGYRTIFDCIFGTGFRGAPKDVYRTAIEKINESHAYVVSVDINSGLNGDSGMCECCVDSDLTLSVGGLKSGLLLNTAKDHINRLDNIDIGIEPEGVTYKLVEPADIAEVFAPRKNYSNKGTYGYTALIGGSREYSGAIRLSNIASAALRSGTGVVKLAVPALLADAVSKYILESTLVALPDKDGHIAYDPDAIEKCIKGTKAVAIGMGIGTSADVEKTIEYILENYDGTVIIDADGLNVIADKAPQIIKTAKARAVLTPHMKEFSRLTKMSIEEILNDPIKTAREYARACGCIVLLKGPTTIVTDGNEVLLTDRGCAGMATAGSGDVLSGILAAVCGYHRDDLLIAVAAGAYINGAAGEAAQKKYGDISMIASDTVSMLPEVIHDLTLSCLY